MSYMNYFVFMIVIAIICFIITHYCIFSHAAQRERNAQERLYRLHKDVYETTAFPDRGDNGDVTFPNTATNANDDENVAAEAISPSPSPLPPQLPSLRYTDARDIETSLGAITVASQRRRLRRELTADEEEAKEETPPPPPLPPKEKKKEVEDEAKSYVNPIARIEPLTFEPERLRDYVLANEPRGASGGGTELYDDWFESERAYVSMFTFQHKVLRYAATESNNEIRKIDAYVRAVAILRDFARRFLTVAENVANRMYALTKVRATRPWLRSDGNDDAIDWRLFVTVSAAHFAQCVRFVRDRSVREPAGRCVALIAGKPFETIGRPDDEIDAITAYRLCYPTLGF